mgnify:CR=1 FL=1
MYGWFLNVVLIFFFIYLSKRFFFVQNTIKGFLTFNNRPKIYIFKEVKVSQIESNFVKLKPKSSVIKLQSTSLKNRSEK